MWCEPFTRNADRPHIATSTDGMLVVEVNVETSRVNIGDFQGTHFYTCSSDDPADTRDGATAYAADVMSEWLAGERE